jgi:hypothetical protein
MDEAELSDRRAEANRGHGAQRLMADPLWGEAWDHVESNLRAYMEDATSPEEVVLEARRVLLAARTLRAWFAEVEKTGELATIQLKQEEERATRAEQRRAG